MVYNWYEDGLIVVLNMHYYWRGRGVYYGCDLLDETDDEGGIHTVM